MKNIEEKNDWKKYIIVFFITIFIFATAFYISNNLNNSKLEEIRKIEDTISIDILSLETQFDLFEELSCENITDSILSKELNELASKIEYGEKNFDLDGELLSLKKYYSLLQIKDFLLMQKATERCNLNIESIIYFYGREDCEDCGKQGYVLTDLRQEYPELRVYSFDYYMDLSAIDALKSIYQIDQNLPALIINERVYKGFKSREDIETIMPELLKIKEKREAEKKALEEAEKKESEKDSTN
ncbi:MAG: hypothetical protein QG580_90 [Patescibacteria group bacterium]|jgi:hypothetical protein|nr:hypothetical protein [Patescibacteria group bacterium]